MAWDSVYESEPTNSTYVADTDDSIRNLKTDIRARVAKEHGFNLTESGAQDGHGKHLRGSARAFVQSAAPTATSVTADDADYATGRLWLDSDDGRLYVYRGGSWSNTIAVTYADNAGTSAACSGNSATATVASSCSGNSATATQATNATNASTLSGYGVSTPPVASTVVVRDGNKVFYGYYGMTLQIHGTYTQNNIYDSFKAYLADESHIACFGAINNLRVSSVYIDSSGGTKYVRFYGVDSGGNAAYQDCFDDSGSIVNISVVI